MLPKTHPLMFRLHGGYSMKPASTQPALVGPLVGLPIFFLGALVGLSGAGGARGVFFGAIVMAVPLIIAADAAWIVVNDTRRTTYLLLVLPFDGRTLVSSYTTLLQRRWRWFLIGCAVLLPLFLYVAAEDVQESELERHDLLSPKTAMGRCFESALTYYASDFELAECLHSYQVPVSRHDLPFAGLSAFTYESPVEPFSIPGEIWLVFVVMGMGVLGLGYMAIGIGVALGMIWRQYVVVLLAALATLFIGVLLILVLMLAVPVPGAGDNVLVVTLWFQAAGVPFALGMLASLLGTRWAPLAGE